MRPVRVVDGAVVTCCGKGTFNGEAAKASPYGFAVCILPFDHPNIGTGCDSGPAPLPEAA